MKVGATYNTTSVRSAHVNVNNVQNTPAQQQNPVDEIIAGKWGSAMRGIFITAGDTLPPGVTNRVIDGMFGWGTGVPLTSQCCRSYARAIVNLLALPTGRNLIKKIITKCYENSMQRKDPKKVVFINNGSENCLIWEYLANNDSSKCDINLKWNGPMNTHVWDEWVLLVRKQNKNELAFVKVKVPPAIVLAHEFGHFLWGLTVCHDTTASSKLIQRVQREAKKEYDKIFRDFTVTNNTKGSRLFIGSWNHGNYLETVNILPIADIPSATNVVDLRYSDGMFVGEALNSTWNANQKPQFTDSKGNNVNVNYNALPVENFIRFGHSSSGKFFREFNSLGSNEQKEFKTLVNKLIGKIKPQGREALKVTDLPYIV
jgi:hypothetical protein